MNDQACIQCQSSPVFLVCGPCQAPICKTCARLLDGTQFALSPKPPVELVHDAFCEVCYQRNVAPLVAAYEEAVEKARDINVFYKSQGKETRFIRRSEKLLRVDDCVDRNEAMLKLAYQAAVAGCNTMVDVEVEPRKIRNGGWQSSRWSGRAVPVFVDEEQLNRRFIQAPN